MNRTTQKTIAFYNVTSVLTFTKVAPFGPKLYDVFNGLGYI